MLALNILIGITFISQIVALSISLRLMRITKFNAAWVLFSIAFILMLVQLSSEIAGNILGKEWIDPRVMVWIWVVTSLCFTSGLFVVNRLIKYINLMERERRISEKRILNTIITTEEKERRRFSSDIHDGLGPLLSSVKLSMSAIKSVDDMKMKQEIHENAEHTINEAIKSLREISNNLSPHILNNFGVTRAISSFVNKLSLPSTMNITFESTLKGERFDSNVETIIYRVVCELINNAIKHSQATKIEVKLSQKDDYIVIYVGDNGKGFDFNTQSETGGLGLSNIASRISSIKGKMMIESTPESGSIINITIKTK